MLVKMTYTLSKLPENIFWMLRLPHNDTEVTFYS